MYRTQIMFGTRNHIFVPVVLLVLVSFLPVPSIQAQDEPNGDGLERIVTGEGHLYYGTVVSENNRTLQVDMGPRRIHIPSSRVQSRREAGTKEERERIRSAVEAFHRAERQARNHQTNRALSVLQEIEEDNLPPFFLDRTRDLREKLQNRQEMHRELREQIKPYRKAFEALETDREPVAFRVQGAEIDRMHAGLASYTLPESVPDDSDRLRTEVKRLSFLARFGDVLPEEDLTAEHLDRLRTLAGHIQSYLYAGDRSGARNQKSEIRTGFEPGKRSRDLLEAFVRRAVPEDGYGDGNRASGVIEVNRDEYDWRARWPEDAHPTRKRPLVILLHGAGGSTETVLRSMRAERFRRNGFFVASVQYLDADDQENDILTIRAGQYNIEYGVVDALIAKLSQNYPIHQNRVYLGGVSQGAHTTWELLHVYPDRFAGAATTLGGPMITAQEVTVNNMRTVPIYSITGAGDETITERLRQMVSPAHRAGVNLHLVTYVNRGHSHPQGETARMIRWLRTHGRNGLPEDFSHVMLRAPQQRVHWMQMTTSPSALPEQFRINSRPDNLPRVIVQKRDPNEFFIEMDRVGRLTLFWSRDLVNLDAPVTVTNRSGDPIARMKPEPDFMYMLEQARETGNHHDLFWDDVTIGN